MTDAGQILRNESKIRQLEQDVTYLETKIKELLSRIDQLEIKVNSHNTYGHGV